MLPEILSTKELAEQMNQQDEEMMEPDVEPMEPEMLVKMMRPIAVEVPGGFQQPIEIWASNDILNLDAQFQSSGTAATNGHVDLKAEVQIPIGGNEASASTDATMKVQSFSPVVDEDADIDICWDDEFLQHIFNGISGIETEIPAQFAQLGDTSKGRHLRSKTKSHSAQILTATSPESFYIALLSWRRKKQRLQLVLNAFYNKMMDLSNNFGRTNNKLLEPGLMVVCWYEGLWRRAEILTVRTNEQENQGPQPNAYTALFIDYGEEDEVTQSQIRYLTKNFIARRRLAQKCTLQNSGCKWNAAAVNRFKEIVQPESRISVKLIQKHEQFWKVSFKMDVTGKSSYDFRHVDIAREISTAQRRERIAAMYKPPSDDDRDEGSEGDRSGSSNEASTC